MLGCQAGAEIGFLAVLHTWGLITENSGPDARTPFDKLMLAEAGVLTDSASRTNRNRR